MKRGIDISYYQGPIDFDLVKNDGIEFVIIREGYRDSTDSRFFEYVNGAKKAGLDILACYHFSYALSPKEASDEALYMIENMKQAGLGPETICFFDLEYDSVKKAAAHGVLLGSYQINNHAVAFCDTILANGYKAGLYMNVDYYTNVYWSTVKNKYLLWMADYSFTPTAKSLFRQYTDKGRISGINSLVDLDYYYGDDEYEFKMEEKYMRSRDAVVNLVKSWNGKNEADGSYKSIIDIYNSYKGQLPRGIKMDYSWPWCACTWSALAIALGYTDIMPIEISCGLLIEKAKEMRVWVENDDYVPLPGDAVLYDWDDNGVGDNTGWPDHIGTVTYVNREAGYFEVFEGNCANAVKKRTVSINGKFIRGFITPRYMATVDNDLPSDDALRHPDKTVSEVAHEVITGIWGNGEERKKAIESYGYNYKDIQNEVNRILNGSSAKPPYQDISNTPELKRVSATCYAKFEDYALLGAYVTAADLYCRNDAGTNKKALCVIPKGTVVNCYGYHNFANGVIWPLISVKLGDTIYEGFCSMKYLNK